MDVIGLKARTLMVPVLLIHVFLSGVSAQSNTLTLNIGQATYKIERAIYGHLLENLGRNIYNGLYVGTNSPIPNTNGFRKDILQAFVDQGQACLEWPGGCASWNYHWKDGIGPKASRPGGEMVNGVGTAEYFELCKLTNSIPYITCNIHSASVAENTAWLNHIDSTPEWKNSLKYWKIGNEEWGGCGGSFTVYNFIAKYKQYVAGIPSSYANKLVRIAEAGTNSGWASVVMDSLMGKMEAISYHYYSVVDWGNKGPSINFTEAQYYRQMLNAYDLENKLRSFETVMNAKDPNNTIGIIVDEWGSWLDEIPGMGALYQQSSVRDAVLGVMSLNIFNNHCKRVKMACAAQAVNVLAASILTQTSPGTAMVKTPTYYVLKLLKPHQNAKMIPVNLTCGSVNNFPVISASASIDSVSTVHISLGNLHATDPQTLVITLSGAAQQYSTVRGQIVNGPTISSYNDFNKAETVTLQDFPSSNFSIAGTKLTVTLPAHSAVMLKLEPVTAVRSQRAGGIFENISIKTAVGGTIIVSGAGIQQLPVRVTLHTADGRMVAGTVTKTGSAGQSRIEWKPIKNNAVAGIYIMKIQGEKTTGSHRVAIFR